MTLLALNKAGRTIIIHAPYFNTSPFGPWRISNLHNPCMTANHMKLVQVLVQTGISKLPCIAMPALFFSVGYPPRHLIYLKIVTCPDVFYEKDQLVPAYLTESYMLV